MELSVLQENFTKALNNASRIATSRTQLPILNNILLRTDGNRLLVAAMNMEVATMHYIGTKIIKPGSITVPARLITEFVSSLPKEKIDLKVEGEHLIIKAGKYSSVINGIAADDFPELPAIDENTAIQYEIAPHDFKQAVNQTIIAASNDTARPILTGVYWYSFEGNLYLAGTDGYRLAERCLVSTESEVAAIIPTNSLQEALRVINDNTSQVTILFDESQVRFKIDDTEITSQLIDGNFPPYRQLIPASNETNVIIKKDDFMRITKIAGLFSRDSGGSVTITADSEKGELSLHSVASELGENTSEATAKIEGGGTITLNSRYISEALSVIDGDTVKFSFSGKLAPTVFESNEKNANYKHIIMPLKS